jgi:hypothetical protein
MCDPRFFSTDPVSRNQQNIPYRSFNRRIVNRRKTRIKTYYRNLQILRFAAPHRLPSSSALELEFGGGLSRIGVRAVRADFLEGRGTVSYSF